MIPTRNDSFRALKLSNQENVRALKYSIRVLNFRMRKYSNLESYRALKILRVLG
jgi:hypothetical protein